MVRKIKSFSNLNVFITILGFIVIGVISRTIGHIAPNFELVTGLSLVAAAMLPRRISWLVPLGIMFFSDLILGNSAIYLFTWSGFIFTWLIGVCAGAASKGRLQKFSFTNTLKVTSMGICSVLIFYFWTNFGVVVLSTMYPLSTAGYLQSLIMALPFLKIQLISVVITVPIIYSIYSAITASKSLVLASIKNHLI